MAIRITVNDKIKVVQFWCDRTDLENGKLSETVQNLYDEYTPDTKYRKIIYRTGERDLLGLTSELVRHNLNIATPT